MMMMMLFFLYFAALYFAVGTNGAAEGEEGAKMTIEAEKKGEEDAKKGEDASKDPKKDGAKKEAEKEEAEITDPVGLWNNVCTKTLEDGTGGLAKPSVPAEAPYECLLPKELFDAGAEADCKTLPAKTKSWICFTLEMKRAERVENSYTRDEKLEVLKRAKALSKKPEGVQGKFVRENAIKWLKNEAGRIDNVKTYREEFAKAKATPEEVKATEKKWLRYVMPAVTGWHVDESTSTPGWKEVPENQRNSCTCPGGEEGERKDESGEKGAGEKLKKDGGKGDGTADGVGGGGNEFLAAEGAHPPKAGTKQPAALNPAQRRRANLEEAPEQLPEAEEAAGAANNGAKKPYFLLRGTKNLLRNVDDKLQNIALIASPPADESDGHDGSCCR
ncbi:unnamed protein product [Amoebophrya sp. A25]|nr:unnamed protein product [Amoebophrya sp. A25]|eukprot:GSA25T00023106001.1